MDAPPRPASGTRLDVDNPWPGLDSYDEAAREFFSGRAAEAEELHRRILDEPMTVLFGKSGLGKTSLLKAGVFPGLREKGFLPVLLRLQLRPDTERLIEQVRLALFDALRAHEIDHPPLRDGETLWEYLHRSGLEFWTKQNRLVRPVFVFDQFEELFTLGRLIAAEVAAFREDLADLAENRIPADVARRLESEQAPEGDFDAQAMPYKIVIALREDFLADLEGWRLTIPSLRRNRMRLLPMGPEQALQAVWNERTNHLVTEPLARKVVAFLSTGAAATNGGGSSEDVGATVEPALLSLFCQGVNEHRKREGKARFDEALLEGAKESIVMDFYRGSLRDQPDRVRRFIEENLVTEHGFRNSYSVDDAVAHGFVTSAELAALIDRHLLRHEHHLGTARVELTHDLLTRAVMEERDGRRGAERNERERLVRRRWMLIAGGCAAAVVVLAAVAIGAVRARNDAVRAEEKAVRAEEKAVHARDDAVRARDDAKDERVKADGLRRTAETQRDEIATTSKKLEVATEQARREAENAQEQKGLAEKARERARSKELAALAEARVNRNPETAVLLALEGLKRTHTPEANSALLAAAGYAWPTAIFEKANPREKADLGGTPHGLALTADGQRLAVLATPDGRTGGAGKFTLTVWNVSPEDQSRVWLWRKSVTSVTDDPRLAFSPDQSLLAVSGGESIQLLHVSSGEVFKSVPDSAGVKLTAFGPHGQFLAWFRGEKIHFWDYRSESAQVSTANSGELLFFVVASDGNRILTVTKALDARTIDRAPDGNWMSATPLSIDARCMKPQSVSPGSRYVSATWKSRACSSGATKDASAFKVRDDKLEASSDVVWSPAGNAFADVLLSQDIIVGQSDRFGAQSGSRIKGVDPGRANDLTSVISVNEAGTRIALIDRGREVRLYFLSDHKLLLSRLDRDHVSVAPGGSWVAAARRPTSGERALIDVLPVGPASAAGLVSGGRAPIEVGGPSTEIVQLDATPNSVVTVLRARQGVTTVVTTVVIDVTTGRPRRAPYNGRAQVLGAERELLLMQSTPAETARVVNVQTGDELKPWEQVPGTDGRPTIITSRGREILVVLRAQTSNQEASSALVYSVRGDSLVPLGQFAGLPASVLRTPSQLQVADDGNQLTWNRPKSRDAEAGRRVWSVTTGRELNAPAADASVVATGPLGGFEVRKTSEADAAGPGLTVVRRADRAVLLSIGGNFNAPLFSSDERWLAIWSARRLQVLDLVRGGIAWTWPSVAQAADEPRDQRSTIRVRGVTFEGRNTVLKVQLTDDSMTLIPLDRDLTERFAKWLVPRGLTARECLRSGLEAEEVCPRQVAGGGDLYAE